MQATLDAKLSAILLAGPAAVNLAKKAALEFPFPLEEAAKRLALARASEEGREGVGAFLEKRPANFVEELGERGREPEAPEA
jgi:methylglutaconyl-CoA hydratase